MFRPVLPALRPLALAAAATLLLAACGQAQAACVEVPGARECVPVIAEGARQPAPERALPTVEGDGELSLGDFRGKVVVLNFWASWCGPCRAEQPELNRAHRSLASDEVVFLGVDVLDAEVNARKHVEEFQIPYPSLYDRDSTFTAEFEGLGPQAIPTTLILDRAGRVAIQLFGTTTKDELAAVLPLVLDET